MINLERALNRGYSVLIVQWNLIVTVTNGLKVCGCNREVAALQSDHYTEVPLYTDGL